MITAPQVETAGIEAGPTPERNQGMANGDWSMKVNNWVAALVSPEVDGWVPSLP